MNEMYLFFLSLDNNLWPIQVCKSKTDRTPIFGMCFCIPSEIKSKL